MGLLRLRTGAVLGVAALLLAACGGGLWLSYSEGDWYDDRPPSIELAAAATTVPAGGRLEVVAAAADESGIDEVAFYRLDGEDWVRLGSDGDPPYEWSVPVPDDGRTTVSVRARATDRTGVHADSSVVTVSVVR